MFWVIVEIRQSDPAETHVIQIAFRFSGRLLIATLNGADFAPFHRGYRNLPGRPQSLKKSWIVNCLKFLTLSFKMLEEFSAPDDVFFPWYNWTVTTQPQKGGRAGSTSVNLRLVYTRDTWCTGYYMVYINIPYVIENDRIDRGRTAKELRLLNIGETVRYETFEAIYNKRPRGVYLADKDQALQLQEALSRLGVPYRQSNEPDYKYDSHS